MKKIFAILFLVEALFAVDISLDQNTTQGTEIGTRSKAYFGEQLFKGNFKENTQFRYNPEYLLNVGDVISVKMWGAYDFAGDLAVDKQGNIFIPKVGIVHLLGLPNKQLKTKIFATVKEVFNKNVYVYADVKQYQPISVFVSGSVQKIGLYSGLSTDSVLQFIDKAGGIIRGQGSYRHITILRHKKRIKHIDLYQFLVGGRVDLFQFRNGDVILVEPVRSFIEVDGDVNRPYIFELAGRSATVRDVMKYVLPKPTTNSFMLTTWSSLQETTKEYPLSMAKKMRVKQGSKLKFFSNHYVNSAEIAIEGEHRGLQNISVHKGTTLYDVLDKTKFTPLSDIKNIRIYRTSVANIQKQLLETMLKDLESRALTSDSSTPEEAAIRSKESDMVIKFIERVRKVQPKGQVIVNKKDNLKKVILEDGDRIFIPKRTNIVIVQGEVGIPNALTYQSSYSISDYIKACGGYSDRANKDKILLVKANGKVIQYDDSAFGGSSPRVEPGDSILVLGKVDTKNLLFAKGITQIIYQVAVGAAVVLRAF